MIRDKMPTMKTIHLEDPEKRLLQSIIERLSQIEQTQQQVNQARAALHAEWAEDIAYIERRYGMAEGAIMDGYEYKAADGTFREKRKAQPDAPPADPESPTPDTPEETASVS